jgi:hypothetical protein
MPLIASALPAALLGALLAVSLGAPLGAQTVAFDTPTAIGIPLTVPDMKGANTPTTLGLTRRGATGRPRDFARVRIELRIEPSCTLQAAFGEPTAIRCSSDLPYQSAVSSDADPEFALPIGASIAPSAPRVGLVAITAQRLTVDY